jgi:hypothetical protein
MSAAPMLFDSFEPGRVIGSATSSIDARLLAMWQQVYGSGGNASDVVPMALVTPLLMRSYMKVIAPRPPGNVQVRKKIGFVAAPRLGEEVRTEFQCARKELRKERHYLTFAARGTGEGERELFTAEMTMIWAA